METMQWLQSGESDGCVVYSGACNHSGAYIAVEHTLHGCALSPLLRSQEMVACCPLHRAPIAWLLNIHAMVALLSSIDGEGSVVQWRRKSRSPLHCAAISWSGASIARLQTLHYAALPSPLCSHSLKRGVAWHYMTPPLHDSPLHYATNGCMAVEQPLQGCRLSPLHSAALSIVQPFSREGSRVVLCY
eukprot:c43221_g1_i1 orf=106-669(+)